MSEVQSHEGATKHAKPPAVPVVPWNTWIALVFAIILFFASQIIAVLLISIYPNLQHWTHNQAVEWLSNSVLGQFLFIALAETIAIGSIIVFVRRSGASIAIIGLKKPRLSDFGYGFLALPIYVGIYFLTVGLVSHFVPSLNVNQRQEIGFSGVTGGVDLLLTFLSLVIIPPIAEEIMVRGFIYSSLKKAVPLIWAAVGTSALFAAAHLPEGGATGPLYIAALDTFILSLVLIYLREKTGSLWASITLHACKNGIAFMTLFILHLT